MFPSKVTGLFDQVAWDGIPPMTSLRCSGWAIAHEPIVITAERPSVMTAVRSVPGRAGGHACAAWVPADGCLNDAQHGHDEPTRSSQPSRAGGS
jgi:hypothetical protein